MRDPGKLFVDDRLTGICVYCGTRPDTRDHSPSKVLLDEPYLPGRWRVITRGTSGSTDATSMGCAASSKRSGIGSDSTHWRSGTGPEGSCDTRVSRRDARSTATEQQQRPLVSFSIRPM
ncbi:hypothetical protein DES47_102859 [Roseateles toxinivorans]|uniref:Uncharacterized protein n=1 Tax=Roseateles toxinivorans TaxID=270368 RepID=A0A4R6QQT9_9BURK|nr:hypothetical protein DES47_102859 [Roseateles toxinivorans]